MLVWLVLYNRGPQDLKIYFFDVGQGDAIFVETPTGKQLLIDAGRNRKVLSELGGAMSFGDRYIDIFIATHPDSDHIGGLPGVEERYEIGMKLDNNTTRRGQVINFGDGVTLTILFPEGDISTLDDNDASVVAKLSYGEYDFLFTGDSGIRTENILLNSSEDLIDVEILQAGHHGSRTSTSLPFVQAASPEYAVISAGKGNSYGHPHKEVLNTLERVGAEILSTAENGTIKFETDGERLVIK